MNARNLLSIARSPTRITTWKRGHWFLTKLRTLIQGSRRNIAAISLSSMSTCIALAACLCKVQFTNKRTLWGIKFDVLEELFCFSDKSCNLGACCKNHRHGMTHGPKDRLIWVALLYKPQPVDGWTGLKFSVIFLSPPILLHPCVSSSWPFWFSIGGDHKKPPTRPVLQNTGSKLWLTKKKEDPWGKTSPEVLTER